MLPPGACRLVIGGWRLAKLMAEARARRDERTIEIDYRVVDDRDRR